MRHHRGFRGGLAPAGPVATLALGVALTAVRAALVLLSRRPQAPAPRLRRTLPAAVTLPAVTV
jgi:hypothetical protein